MMGSLQTLFSYNLYMHELVTICWRVNVKAVDNVICVAFPQTKMLFGKTWNMMLPWGSGVCQIMPRAKNMCKISPVAYYIMCIPFNKNFNKSNTFIKIT